jgi:hypothetical protein
MTPRLVVRSEEDMIAMASVVLGFEPEHSLVMLTFNKFHARVDLPHEPADIEMVISAMLAPVLRHSVEQVAFIVFDEGDNTALEVQLVSAFQRAGVNILATFEVGSSKYRRFGQEEWQPLDLAGNALMMEANYLGVAPTHNNRETMAASITPCGAGWSEDVDQAVDHLMKFGVEGVVMTFSRSSAVDTLAFWSEALRGSHPGSRLSEKIALVVAFAAWLAGNGALAWAALDLADTSDEWHRLLTMALEQAVDPREWSNASE